MSEIVASSEIATISPARVDGLPKSGRFWKKKQVFRSSATLRKGALSHLCQTLEERNEKKLKDKVAKDLEKEMVEATKRKKQEERQRREEQDKRRMANEFKTTSFQEIRPDKIKGMSKKQLRSIKKTSMNQNGQLEFVSPWMKGKDNKKKR